MGATLRRRKVAPTVYPIAPVGVAVRRSTDLVATEDPRLAQAMRFIRAEALRGIRVADVLRQVPMSRTLLERKFRAAFGRSPYETIQDVRSRHAESMLRSTDLPIAEVAERCGFLTAEYFSAWFKKRTGTSPRGFREMTDSK